MADRPGFPDRGVKWSHATNLWQEFKAFAFKGNLIDLAVAVVLGAAFGDVIKAVVADVIMPIVSVVTPGQGNGYESWTLWRFPIGHLMKEVLNFLLVAGAVFLVIVKLLGSVVKRAASTPTPAEPTNKECHYCLSMIPLKASRCAYCTSELAPADAAPPMQG